MDDIILVDGKQIKSPSGWKWKKQDISSKDAGRTDDTKMHKNRIGQKRALSLSWSCLNKQEIHEILKVFSPEYVFVTYWDPADGKDVTKEFYTGDMEADVQWWAKGKERYSKLSFDIVER